MRLRTPFSFRSPLLVGWLVLATVVVALPVPALAQGTRADYQRADRLRQLTRGTVTRASVHPQWTADGSACWYRVDLGDGQRQFVRVDAERGRREPAFDHRRMARALSGALNRPVDPDRLPIDRLRFGAGDDDDDDDDTLQLLVAGRAFACDLRRYRLRSIDETDLTLPRHAPTATPRSRNGGGETAITFVNRRSNAIRLWWVAADGERHEYATVEPGQSYRQHTFAGHAWLVTTADGTPLVGFVGEEAPAVAVITDEQVPQPDSSSRRRDPRRSPDGRWFAFFRNHNLWVRDTTTNRERALTTNGTREHYYEWPLAWSPDSRRLVAFRTVPGQEHDVHFVESSPDDQLQPKLHTVRGYLKPGDRIAIRKPHLFELPGGTHTEVPDDLFPNPWMITEVQWTADSSDLLFVYNQRGHQVMRVIRVDGASGRAKAVVDEQCDACFDYANRFFYRYLPDTDEIIWMSERDGWNHLYLYDARSGRVKNRITRGEWVVRGVEQVDVEERRLLIRAGGLDRDQDPYYVHWCRVDFDGDHFVDLTPGDGTHDITFSPDGRYLVDRYSRVDMAPVTELRDARDGSLVCELERGDASALVATGWKWPERFVAKGRDGRTDIHGVIWRPTNFDEDARYPVIEYIYAGPGQAYVPKAFQAWNPQMKMAELGFIVVQIDGMGTGYRSREFNTKSWKNLGDSGFPDRIPWIRAAARKHPQMDLDRVGIYGGSAGGQSTLRALLAHGDFYKVGVADCGCHDNRMDKIWWNELYMGWPVGPHYEEQSNVTNAHRLTGKLMLVVGELDRNVDPASTMQVVDALIQADKDFDLLVMPGVGHGAAEHPYASRRRADFFVRHLLGVEPRRE